VEAEKSAEGRPADRNRKEGAGNSQPGEQGRAAQENLWLALVCNAAYPAAVLSWLSGPDALGPEGALIAALVVPLLYGVRAKRRSGSWSVFAVVGVLSTLLTGGLGLMHLGGIWFAVKEAAVPLTLAAAIPLSARFGKPLVRALFYNDQLLRVRRIEEALRAKGEEAEVEGLLAVLSRYMLASLGLSAVLNFTLALWFLRSEPGTTAFAKELGKLTGVSYPVIVLPSAAILLIGLWRLLAGIERLTGLDPDEFIRVGGSKDKSQEKASPAPDGKD